MAGGSGPRNAFKRLLKELETWRIESEEETGIERLGPPNDGDLLNWEAVINGRGAGSGYDEGRWLLRIQIPHAYPLEPPEVEFVTPVVHPNVSLTTGEICLDLFKDAWSPAYSILEVVRAVRMLLSCPETDSPLNVDFAALMRAGDLVGCRALVELWCDGEGGRYDGD